MKKFYIIAIAILATAIVLVGCKPDCFSTKSCSNVCVEKCKCKIDGKCCCTDGVCKTKCDCQGCCKK